MSLQTCVSFFIMFNTKEDILKNQTVGVPIDFHIREINTIEVNGDNHLQNTFVYVQLKKELSL